MNTARRLRVVDLEHLRAEARREAERAVPVPTPTLWVLLAVVAFDIVLIRWVLSWVA
jgi:hypothetical protein